MSTPRRSAVAVSSAVAVRPSEPGEGRLRGYRLRCRVCGAVFADDGVLLSCRRPHRPGLLVSDYAETRLEPDDAATGMFRYRRWLPVGACPDGDATRTVTYRSPALSRITGLPNLWISFNGHWQERGATLPTGTFKDLEAAAVLARLGEQRRATTLILASAGNTAAALARACSDVGQACLVIVPESGLGDLRFAGGLSACVRVLAVTGGADYSDALALADRITDHPDIDCMATGGAANVARRDAVGTVLLAATETIGRIPDYYVQAVGSGAGGIAAYEAGVRLIADRRYGDRLPRLLLSQNHPYAPMVRAWRAGTRRVVLDAERARAQIRQLSAPVLSTRRPAYSLVGGVFDALVATGGDMLAVSNTEATATRRLIEDTEGVDPDPAAAVALASLLRAAREGWMEPDAVVLLNITGGGRVRLLRDRPASVPAPTLAVGRADLSHPDTLTRIAELTT